MWRYVRACSCMCEWKEERAGLFSCCSAGRRDAALLRLYIRPFGDGRGAACEGRRRAAEDKCEHRVRLHPLPIALTHALAEYAWLPLGDVPVCIPLLLTLSLKTALRLQGVSAIADTRLGQSGSSLQQDMVHNMSLQQVRDIGADRSPPHFLVNASHQLYVDAGQ